jgi:hypothetical protein
MAMTNEESMQREANLIVTIRAKLPDFARMCADDSQIRAMLSKLPQAPPLRDSIRALYRRLRRTIWNPA